MTGKHPGMMFPGVPTVTFVSNLNSNQAVSSKKPELAMDRAKEVAKHGWHPTKGARDYKPVNSVVCARQFHHALRGSFH